MSSMYSTFQTDQKLETEGVIIDYGDFRVRLAAAGQGNKSYARYAEKKLKPVRRAMEAGTLSNERSSAIMADIYAQTVVLMWETKKDGEWVEGIDGEDGELLPFNKANVELTLVNLPRLFVDLQEQAMSLANFRKDELETEAGN